MECGKVKKIKNNNVDGECHLYHKCNGVYSKVYARLIEDNDKVNTWAQTLPCLQLPSRVGWGSLRDNERVDTVLFT